MQKKKGISLIVLIITIVVMIILASTIIISLSNNGIIGKANEAVIANDIANLKTQVEMLKGEKLIDALGQGRNLTQQELIEAIQAYYPGSTVNGSIITVENGKYDIVVQENLNVAVVEHGKYTGPIKDIEVTYTTTEEEEGTRVNLKVEWLNAKYFPSDNNEKFEGEYLDEFLNWLDIEGLFNKIYNVIGPSPEEFYESDMQPYLGVSYEEFMNDPSRDVLVKNNTEYESTAEWLKYILADDTGLADVNYRLAWIIYAKEMHPELESKSKEEIELIIKGLYDDKKTIDEIAYEVVGSGFDEWHNEQNWGFSEDMELFNKQQSMLLLALAVYGQGNRVIIEYPNGTKVSLEYTDIAIEDSSFIATEVGNHTIKVTSPSGYVVEKIITLADTTAPTVEIDITNVTLNTITIKANATDAFGIKEYRYYIKGPNDTDYVLKAKTLETTYTYEGLTGGTEYEILVGVEDNAGNIGKASINKTLWITAMVDGVPIPKGFVASPYEGEKTKDGGLVIYELAENETVIPSSETEHTSKTTRNQYVWVPVEDFKSQFIRQNFGCKNSSGNSPTISNKLGSNYWEVVLDTTTNMPLPSQSSTYMTTSTPNGGITNTLAEVQAMYESVKTYKGFYIARYEAGLDLDNYKTEDDGQIESTVYSQMNKAPYNYVRWTYNNKMNEDTNGAVQVARSIYPQTNANYGVVSTLTYGVQWDRTLAWWVETKAKNGTGDVTIEDNDDLNNSILYGNYYDNEIPNATFNAGAYVSKDSGKTYTEIGTSYSKTSSQGHLLTTGATTEARVNNIYDMAGNLMEWTMEGGFTNGRVLRGGGYSYDGDNYPVSYRYNFDPDNAINVVGFRSSLYIKK